MTMRFLICFSMILFGSGMFAQADITPQVTAALKKGDAIAIAANMTTPVELTLNGQDNNISKEQAQQMLGGFFKDHVVSTFVVKHQGTSKLDDQYRIGDMMTSKGNFRVTFFMKKSGSAMQIRQLKIEATE